MVTCDICGKEFKTAQGLRGHLTFHHGVSSKGNGETKKLVTEEDIRKLEDRLTALEQNAGNSIGAVARVDNSLISSYLQFLEMTVTALAQKQADQAELLGDVTDLIADPSPVALQDVTNTCWQRIKQAQALLDEIRKTSDLLRQIIGPATVVDAVLETPPETE